MSDHEITDGEKWQLRELFKSFFSEVSLSKNHLQVIENNYSEDLREKFNEFRKSITKKNGQELDAIKADLQNLETKVMERVGSLTDDLKPIKFWISSVKWFFVLILTSFFMGFFTWVFTKF